MRLLIFCFIIIIYSCSAKRFSEDKKDDFFKEFPLFDETALVMEYTKNPSGSIKTASMEMI